MKIIVNDYVYVEFGLEREIVSKAIDEYKIYDDPLFQDLIEKLEDLHGLNHSFLNI